MLHGLPRGLGLEHAVLHAQELQGRDTISQLDLGALAAAALGLDVIDTALVQRIHLRRRGAIKGDGGLAGLVELRREHRRGGSRQDPLKPLRGVQDAGKG